MKQVDLSIVDSNFLDTYIDSIAIDDIKTKLRALNLPILGPIIRDLERIIKADVNTIKSSYLNLLDSLTKEEKKKVELAFDYSEHRKQEPFMQNFQKLNIKSCPFCNNNYVYYFQDGKNTIATLEHYYPKSKYPHLSLSFYNLIPSCYVCNTKFKGSEKHVGNVIHPYIEDFNQKASFSVDIDSLPAKKDIQLNIYLKSDDPRCKQSIDRFKLDKIYAEHSDIATEIWNKVQIYNEDRIRELYDSFYKQLGYSEEDVKNFVFCNYLNQKDINKRNHAKLTQDILKQFELI
ncbi:MAG: hypothetical protein JU82_10095 [Sulfuricurvum sp. MLSB]|uniref:hypothetical protein n=1 Tax=unclassified Sulfuricurvum TaxID=2632390 RepID=UPI0005059BEF|nr:MULTISPECIES: hypothetical protein [unclassified Sulfuricurvum]KFN38791.1 MAG: hypothetical protein JU82_10095 [Sulfuricurvum sp. MLSB]